MAEEQKNPTVQTAEAQQEAETSEVAGTPADESGEGEPSKASAAAFRDLAESGSVESKGKLDMVLDVSVPVTVELGRTEIEIGQLLKLGLGSVVPLDRQAGEPVDIYVRDLRFATGEIVVVDDHFAVRITDVVDPQLAPGGE